MAIKPNNNPKNRQAYIDFQRRMLELEKKTRIQARKETIKRNIENWVSMLPENLKNAKYDEIPVSVKNKIYKGKVPEDKQSPIWGAIKPPFDKRIIIYGTNPYPLSFVTYSLVRGLIKSGRITPSQVKRTSLLDGFNNINGMFNSRSWKDNFLDPNAKLLIIEGCSKELLSLAPKGEEQFWRELDDFIRNQDVLVILNYLTSEEEKEKELIIPILSNDEKYNKKLILKSAFLKLEENEEKEIDKKRKIN